MSNARDPFEMEDGFEDIPVVQKPVQTVNKVANTVVKQTAQQIKATTNAILSQLYGSSAPSANDAQQVDTTIDPTTQQVQNVQHGVSPVSQATHQASAAAGQMAANSSDEAQLEAARRKLEQTHASSYYVPTFGDIGHLESEIQKEAQKRQQRDQEREQEKEQEEQKMEELKEQKKKEPIALTRAKNKAESNRGAAG